MNKVAAILIVVLINFTSFTQIITEIQEPLKQREVGFTTNNFNDFGLIYRFGQDNKLWALNAAVANFNINLKEQTKLISQNYRLTMLREKRKKLTDKFDFRIGYGLGLGFSQTINTQPIGVNPDIKLSQRANGYSTSLTGLLGFNYHFKKNFFVGISILPNFTYTHLLRKNDFYDAVEEVVKESTSASNNFNFSLSNTNCNLSINYSF